MATAESPDTQLPSLQTNTTTRLKSPKACPDPQNAPWGWSSVLGRGGWKGLRGRMGRPLLALAGGSSPQQPGCSHSHPEPPAPRPPVMAGATPSFPLLALQLGPSKGSVTASQAERKPVLSESSNSGASFLCPRFLSEDARQRRCRIACSRLPLNPCRNPGCGCKLRHEMSPAPGARARPGRTQKSAGEDWPARDSPGHCPDSGTGLRRLLRALTASGPANASPGWHRAPRRHRAPCRHPSASPWAGHGSQSGSCCADGMVGVPLPPPAVAVPFGAGGRAPLPSQEEGESSRQPGARRAAGGRWFRHTPACSRVISPADTHACDATLRCVHESHHLGFNSSAGQESTSKGSVLLWLFIPRSAVSVVDLGNFLSPAA